MTYLIITTHSSMACADLCKFAAFLTDYLPSIQRCILASYLFNRVQQASTWIHNLQIINVLGEKFLRGMKTNTCGTATPDHGICAEDKKFTMIKTKDEVASRSHDADYMADFRESKVSNTSVKIIESCGFISFKEIL